MTGVRLRLPAALEKRSKEMLLPAPEALLLLWPLL